MQLVSEEKLRHISKIIQNWGVKKKQKRKDITTITANTTTILRRGEIEKWNV